MIRNSLATVAAILSLTTVALGQPNTTPTITLMGGSANEFNWTFTAGGRFTTPIVDGNTWSLTNMSLIVFPLTGGRSDTYPVSDGSTVGSWTSTTAAYAQGQYAVFAIATATLPNTTRKMDISSQVITATIPAGNFAGTTNTTAVVKTYASMKLFSPSRVNNTMSATAQAGSGTYNGTLNAGPNLDLPPVMVLLPEGGGEFFRTTDGVWGSPQGKATTNTVANQLLQGTRYYSYIFCQGTCSNGDTQLNTSNLADKQ